MTEPANRPVLDQQTFDKLLEAAYVIQEHNRRMRELEENLESQSEKLRQQDSANQLPRPTEKHRDNDQESPEAGRSSDYTLTLAEIVEAQNQIQMRHLDLDKAMAVVAERIARITGASGAGIGVLEGKMVRYRAGAGAPALPPGTEVPLKTAICYANVRTGQVIRTEDVNMEFLFDPEPCRQRGILSLVAVPIYHDGSIVGALELYFDTLRGFAEQDIHTCQLMAGLVTEAIGRDAGLALRKSMAAERSTMLAAIERLQPNPASWADDPAASEAARDGAIAATAAKSLCWKCGSTLLAQEQFCGKCGAPRASDGETSSMQSKLASAWHMQQTGHLASAAAVPNGASRTSEALRTVAGPGQKTDAQRTDETASELDSPFSLPGETESHSSEVLAFNANAAEDGTQFSLSESDSEIDEELPKAASTALAGAQQGDVVWSSAARARDFLESLSATPAPNALVRFWRSHRGDFYLAVALILVVAVIRWGIWSNHSVAATGRAPQVSTSATPGKPSAPEANLSVMDKLLIGLGLAEAPPPPEYKGNPDVQVWVDLHTALYYCPGSDLYGKTPQGKLTSQRDAQLDQFEPASRKACE